MECLPGLDPGSRGNSAERDPGSMAGMTGGFLGLLKHHGVQLFSQQCILLSYNQSFRSPLVALYNFYQVNALRRCASLAVFTTPNHFMKAC